jgi:hypothetical protein
LVDQGGRSHDGLSNASRAGQVSWHGDRSAPGASDLVGHLAGSLSLHGVANRDVMPIAG